MGAPPPPPPPPFRRTNLGNSGFPGTKSVITYTPSSSRVRVPERTSMLRYTPDGRGVAAVMTGVSSPAAGVGGWGSWSGARRSAGGATAGGPPRPGRGRGGPRCGGGTEGARAGEVRRRIVPGVDPDPAVDDLDRPAIGQRQQHRVRRRRLQHA